MHCLQMWFVLTALAHAVRQGYANELLQMYAVHLLASGQAALLPPYACHLRADLRASVFALHLRLLTEGAAPEACLAAFEEASAWFGLWGGAGHGDVAPNEMARLVEQARRPGACLRVSRGKCALGRRQRSGLLSVVVTGPKLEKVL